MKLIRLLLLFFFPVSAFCQFSKDEIGRYEKQAKQVTIIRDNWGIPHVYGKTDADAVFGLLYAQCEDDFKRVEMNYIEKLGRLAEVNGERDLYNDLLIRMVLDSTDAKNDYEQSPDWLKKLCNAFADGVNYYLYKHSSVKPFLLKHFEPWYPLLWTDGSIGAISTADLDENDLKNLYENELSTDNKTDFIINSNSSVQNKLHYNEIASSNAGLPGNSEQEERLTGSNGFAFAPSITKDGNAILYINPHVTLYFRPEVHMVSEEGLNVYGAVTWGQFFVYQGFNEHCGWMHTSSDVDASDAYIEKISGQNNQWMYEYEHQLKPVTVKNIAVSFKQKDSIQTKNFPVLFTHHGPVIAKKNNQWLSVKSYNRSLNGLMQCWLRTKTTSFDEFKKVLDLKGNTSNNTVYADAQGNIAYWHGNFIPVRDTNYDWSKPVDGSIAATEWKGVHSIDETVHLFNPKNGWLQNCNSTPFTVAGDNSPKKKDYPAYMAPDGQNFRGINAVRVLASENSYTIDKVIKAGYNTYLAAFEKLIPALIRSHEALQPGDSEKAILQQPIEVLKHWDLHSGENSVATTLAIQWATKLLPKILQVKDGDFVYKTETFAANALPRDLLTLFVETIKELKKNFGKWDIPWGEINRFQRLNDELTPRYNDSETSMPVGFASSQWGQIPSYASRSFPNTKKRYGVGGNSFICAVEFGKTIKARSLLAGGESGDVHSKHFTDQASMYTKGQFKDVLFYKDDVLKHAEKTYHPGE